MDPRASGKYVASKAQHVTIHERGIDKCAEEVIQRIRDGRLSLDLKLYKIFSVHPESTKEEDVNWVFVTSALNFSFWNDENDPQYLVTYKDRTQNGYMSMCAAMNRTIEQGIPLVDPKFFGSITEDQLNEYFMGDGNIPCPMIKERVKCLHGLL